MAPLSGRVSPVRSLMSVDLPAPLGPTTPTRDESETAHEASLSEGCLAPG